MNLAWYKWVFTLHVVSEVDAQGALLLLLNKVELVPDKNTFNTFLNANSDQHNLEMISI